jgi:hypothetical protein
MFTIMLTASQSVVISLYVGFIFQRPSTIQDKNELPNVAEFSLYNSGLSTSSKAHDRAGGRGGGGRRPSELYRLYQNYQNGCSIQQVQWTEGGTAYIGLYSVQWVGTAYSGEVQCTAHTVLGLLYYQVAFV